VRFQAALFDLFETGATEGRSGFEPYSAGAQRPNCNKGQLSMHKVNQGQ
jgi:hypothetical protein